MSDPLGTETTPPDPHIPLLDEVVAPDAEPSPPQPAEATAELDLEAAREALKTRLEMDLRGMVETTVCAAVARAAAGLEQMLRHEVCRNLEPRIAQLVDEALAEALPPVHQDRVNGSANERE